MRRFVSLFVLVSALSLIATVTGSSGAGPLVRGHGTFGVSSATAQFSVSPGNYQWTRLADGAFITGKVQCVFQSGNFAAVGGTITDATLASVVTLHFLVYFSGQTTTGPNIDPETDAGAIPLLPVGFPANCPSSFAVPDDQPFRQLFSGFIKYAA